jgi:cytoskeletal protein CcmA (bactofilin family)
MENKNQPDLIILLVMFVSAILVIAGALRLFGEISGSVFVGSSIMVSGSLICRALQWAGKE